ncbi:MAG: hypothetical protein HC919_01420 [Oscillatoriales cyanobacterium SM2_2_1]|nr:hypothetical protein [Oscillatoriales cyanobacterium SM2_2_1]
MERRTNHYLALQNELDKLEELLLGEGGPRIMGRVFIDDEKVCRQIDEVRYSMPESVQRAEEILQQKQHILEEAQQYAQNIVLNAQQEYRRLVEESGIMRQAEMEALQLRQRTQAECEDLRNQTINEVQQMLRQAQKENETMRQRAKAEADELIRGAEQYSVECLTRLEAQLSGALKTVQNGLRDLRQ